MRRLWIVIAALTSFNMTGLAAAQSQVIRCESNDGRRQYCPADTRGGVRLSQQISGSACVQNSTWGYDNRGIWVDNGCRAEFILSAGYGVTRSGVTPGPAVTLKYDSAGNIIAGVDAAGNVAWTQEYGPDGSVTQRAWNGTVNWRYATREQYLAA